MTIWRLLVLASMLLTGHASAAAASPRCHSEKRANLVTGCLDNGLRFVIAKGGAKGRVRVGLVVQVGNVSTGESETGYAHFVEHILLQYFFDKYGKKIEKYKIFPVLEMENGSTRDTTTEFKFEAGNERAAELLTYIRQISSGRTIRQEDVQKEKGIFAGEWQRGHFPAYDRALRRVFSAYPFTEDFEGLQKSIEMANAASVTKFYEKWYIPSKQIVYVYGDIDVGATEKDVISLFSDIARADNNIVGEAAHLNERPLRINIRDRHSLLSYIAVRARSKSSEAMSGLDFELAEDIVRSRIAGIFNDPGRFGSLEVSAKASGITVRLAADPASTWGAVQGISAALEDIVRAGVSKREYNDRYAARKREVERFRPKLELPISDGSGRSLSEVVYALAGSGGGNRSLKSPLWHEADSYGKFNAYLKLLARGEGLDVATYGCALSNADPSVWQLEGTTDAESCSKLSSGPAESAGPSVGNKSLEADRFAEAFRADQYAVRHQWDADKSIDYYLDTGKFLPWSMNGEDSFFGNFKQVAYHNLEYVSDTSAVFLGDMDRTCSVGDKLNGAGKIFLNRIYTRLRYEEGGVYSITIKAGCIIGKRISYVKLNFSTTPGRQDGLLQAAFDEIQDQLNLENGDSAASLYDGSGLADSQRIRASFMNMSFDRGVIITRIPRQRP